MSNPTTPKLKVPPNNPRQSMIRGSIMKRPSIFGKSSLLMSLINKEKSRSDMKWDDEQTRLKMEPSYQLEPTDSTKFMSHRVSEVTKAVLNHVLRGMTYDPTKIGAINKVLTTRITERVKDLGYKRYKFVTYVVTGQLSDQDIRVASRCVWNSRTDGVSWETYQNSSIFCTVMVFGVYFD